MKILIATEKPFASIAIESIMKVVNESGHELLLLEKYVNKQQLLDAIAEVDALIVRSDKVDESVIAAATRLKIIVRAGAGYDNIDLAAATARNIIVMNTPVLNANAVAELAFGLLLYAVGRQFSGVSGTELRGKTLGLYAFGAIAQRTAHIAQGFDMNVIAYSPTGHPEKIKQAGFKATESPEELFKESDIISLHIPSTPETQGCIGRHFLSCMKPNALLINTARKDIINEPDLETILEERSDLKYYTDLKPTRHEEFIQKFGIRYFATPKKMGAQTAEANINAGIAAAKQILDYFNTGNTKFQVNK